LLWNGELTVCAAVSTTFLGFVKAVHYNAGHHANTKR
jgi:uncharacterized protein YsxB (DUF464 family)